MSYTQYKRTEEYWLDKIPLTWETKRIKALFTFGKGLPITKEDLIENGIPVISYGQVHSKDNDGTGIKQGLFRYVSDDYLLTNPQSLVNYNDFIFADTSEDRAGCGNCVFVDTDDMLFAGYHSIILRNRNSINGNNNKYLSYLFLTDAWRYQIRSNVDGVKLFSITKDVLGNASVILPPLDEQDQIVRYLDWKTSRINKLIRGYQQEIVLIGERAQSEISSAVLQGLDKDVKMKPAGLQNIDYIPEHWRILQNKRIFAERTELSTTGDETLLSVSKHYGVKPYDDLTDSEQYATIKPAESLIGYKKVMRHDVAMNIMRARNGSYGVSEYDGIVSSAYAVFKPIIECNPRYIHYLLKTPQVIGIFESYSYGIAEHRRRLYAVDFLRLHLPVPPVAEQDDIARYIERVQGQAQNTIQKIQKEIDLLREYRTRLISDVVTGQMDVRGIEIPEYTIEEDMDEITATDDMTDEEVYADAE